MPRDRTARTKRACTVAECDKPHDARGYCKNHYEKLYDPEQRRARQRAKTHRRKTVGRRGDVTPTYERELRAKVKRCPLCGVGLVNEPYQPASKELDHMVPLNPSVGGTHTVGNVRIICRTCNLARPKDGSDYCGPVTLWAYDHAAVVRAPRRRRPSPPRYCQCGAEKSKGRCFACDPRRRVAKPTPAYVPAKLLTEEQRRERGRKAAEMRARGSSWWDIAQSLAYGRESSACLAAAKYADTP